MLLCKVCYYYENNLRLKNIYWAQFFSSAKFSIKIFYTFLFYIITLSMQTLDNEIKACQTAQLDAARTCCS